MLRNCKLQSPPTVNIVLSGFKADNSNLKQPLFSIHNRVKGNLDCVGNTKLSMVVKKDVSHEGDAV